MAESMRPKAEWIKDGSAVVISTGDASVTVPSDQLEDLTDTLSRMAYHGYIKHEKAPTGSDYGRKAKDVEDDHE